MSDGTAPTDTQHRLHTHCCTQVTNIPDGYEVVFEEDDAAVPATASNNADATTSSAAAVSASAPIPSPSTPVSDSNPATTADEGVFRAKASKILSVSTTAEATEPSPKKRSFFQKLWSKSPFAKKKRGGGGGGGDSNSARTKMEDAKALDARLNGP